MGVKFETETSKRHSDTIEYLNIRCDKCNDLVFGLYKTEDYRDQAKWREYYFWCIQSSLDKKYFHFSLDGDAYCQRCYSHYQPDREPEKPFMDMVRDLLFKYADPPPWNDVSEAMNKTWNDAILQSARDGASNGR